MPPRTQCLFDVGEAIEAVVVTHVYRRVGRLREVVLVDIGSDPLDGERAVLASFAPVPALALTVPFAFVLPGAFECFPGDIDRIDVVTVLGEREGVPSGAGRDVERAARRERIDVGPK
jgi:hypothetical protein